MSAAVVAVALGLGSAGCATVYRSSPGALDRVTVKGAGAKPAEVVYISTSGFYFLWTLPIASGDLRWDAAKRDIKGGTVFFRDLAGVAELQTALLNIAESRNCDVVDIVYYDHDTSYAGPSYEGAVGVLFGSSELGVSGVLVPREGKNGGAK